MTVDAATCAEVINALIAKLHAHYVFPAVAQQIEADLRQQLATGKLQSETAAQAFCDALTQTLQAISHDKHLNVRYSAKARLPANHGPSDTDTVAEDSTWRETYREERRLHNYGFARVERLPGNVGYLDLRGFADPAIGGEAAVAAMNLLAHTSALIIDLRQNGGGWPDMVALLTTYLFDQEIVHLNSLYWRHGDKTQQFWTLPYVPGSRFGGKKPYMSSRATIPSLVPKNLPTISSSSSVRPSLVKPQVVVPILASRFRSRLILQGSFQLDAPSIRSARTIGKAVAWCQILLCRKKKPSMSR